VTKLSPKDAVRHHPKARDTSVAPSKRSRTIIRAAKKAINTGIRTAALEIRPAGARNAPADYSTIRLSDKDLINYHQTISKHRQAIKALRGSYRSAINPRSRLANLTYNLTGDQQADEFSRRYMRELSRDLERNAATNEALTQVWSRLVIGEGVRSRPTTSNPAWNEAAGDLVHELFQQIQGGLDARQMRSWYQMQGLLARSVFRDGDMGVLKLASGRIQLVEAEQISGGTMQQCPQAQCVANGVAYGHDGEPLAYFAAEYDHNWAGLGGAFFGEARAYTPDEFLFCGIMTRYSQTRGCPMLATCLDDFERLDSYAESEVIAAEIGSQNVGAMEFPKGLDPTNWRTPPSDEDPQGNGFDGGRNQDGTIDFQPTSAGSIIVCPNGVTYKPINPERPNKDAEPFMIAMLRQMCSVPGLPYEIAFNDLRSLSWSTARSLVSSAREQIAHWQKTLFAGILSNIYRWTIARAIEAGLLPENEEWASHEHEWPEIAWPDPMKETMAQGAQLALGTTSPQRISGHVWSKILDEQAEAQAYRDKLFSQRFEKAIALINASPALKAAGLTAAMIITGAGSIASPVPYLEAVAKIETAQAATTTADKPAPGPPSPHPAPSPAASQVTP
jgi:capsid protein